MGIYDRDYYRSDGRSVLSMSMGQVSKWLIIINVIAFVLQLATRVRSEFGYLPGPFTQTLWLDTDAVLHGQVWRLLTCAFLHSPENILHIVFNMLALWWFGKAVEDIYGPKEFLWYYLMSAVISSLAYMAFELTTAKGDFHPALGASGAVTACMVL